MRFLSTYLHACIDYALVALCLLAPLVFNLGSSDQPAWAHWLIGLLLLAANLMSDYDISIARWIPLRAHLDLDLALGLGLMGAPWILGFASDSWLPHVVLGAAQVCASLLCHVRPEPIDEAQLRSAR